MTNFEKYTMSIINESLNTENDELKAKLKSAEDALERIRKTAAKIDDENDELKEYNQRLKLEVDELRKEIDEYETVKNTLEGDNEDLEQEIRELKDTNCRLNMKLDKEVECYKTLIDKYEDLKRKLDEQHYIDTDIATTHQMQNTILSQENEQLKTKIKNLRLVLNSVYGSRAYGQLGTLISQGVRDGMRDADVKRYTKHLHNVVESLEAAGFSHDDAMSLIPIWNEEDFEEWRKL